MFSLYYFVFTHLLCAFLFVSCYIVSCVVLYLRFALGNGLGEGVRLLWWRNVKKNRLGHFCAWFSTPSFLPGVVLRGVLQDLVLPRPFPVYTWSETRCIIMDRNENLKPFNRLVVEWSTIAPDGWKNKQNIWIETLSQWRCSCTQLAWGSLDELENDGLHSYNSI